MENEIKTYLAHIAIKFELRYKLSDIKSKEYYELATKEFRENLKVVKGTKYTKVVKGGSVHSFIVMEDTKDFKKGDILKAASWKAPAKNFSRGNVYDVTSYINVDWTGA
jgi:hypothetical protein